MSDQPVQPDAEDPVGHEPVTVTPEEQAELDRLAAEQEQADQANQEGQK